MKFGNGWCGGYGWSWATDGVAATDGVGQRMVWRLRMEFGNG
ncbi:MAG: hypothetical protein AAF630_15380 [Cyanobacteria bacterium P01_C01_bin.38]